VLRRATTERTIEVYLLVALPSSLRRSPSVSLSSLASSPPLDCALSPPSRSSLLPLPPPLPAERNEKKRAEEEGEEEGEWDESRCCCCCCSNDCPALSVLLLLPLRLDDEAEEDEEEEEEEGWAKEKEEKKVPQEPLNGCRCVGITVSPSTCPATPSSPPSSSL